MAAISQRLAIFMNGTNRFICGTNFREYKSATKNAAEVAISSESQHSLLFLLIITMVKNV
jgi:hypothetical protein